MNTHEIAPGTNGDLRYYVAFAVPLTILTIWIVIAFQSRYLLGDKPFILRLGWPYFLFQRWWSGKRAREARAKRVLDRTMRDDYEEGMETKVNDSWVWVYMTLGSGFLSPGLWGITWLIDSTHYDEFRCIPWIFCIYLHHYDLHIRHANALDYPYVDSISCCISRSCHDWK